MLIILWINLKSSRWKLGMVIGYKISTHGGVGESIGPEDRYHGFDSSLGLLFLVTLTIYMVFWSPSFLIYKLGIVIFILKFF